MSATTGPTHTPATTCPAGAVGAVAAAFGDGNGPPPARSDIRRPNERASGRFVDGHSPGEMQ